MASVGSRGDNFDNALAESFNSPFKTEPIRHCDPTSVLDDMDCATLECIDWFNRYCVHGALGMVPPAEFEVVRYQAAPALLVNSQYSESPPNPGRFSRDEIAKPNGVARE